MKYGDPIHIDDVAVDFPELERIADKVIYGSDWPGVPTLKENIQAVKDLPISEDAKRKILGENAARLLKVTQE